MRVSVIPVLAVILLSSPASLAQGPVEFDYQLYYMKENKVRVSLSYHPVETDSTVFTYGEPDFGGQPDILNCLADFKVDAPASFRSIPAERKFILYFTGSDTVKVEYTILDTSTRKKDVRQELFRPVISRDYFYTHGVNLFLNPHFRKDNKKAVISINWEKRPDFKLFYGFDPDNGGKKKSVSTTDSVMFSLITGAKDLTIDKFELHGIQNYIVLRGGVNQAANRKAVRSYFTRFNESIRRFWNDYSDSCFSLVLQPFLQADHNIGGVAFANGFIGKYKADTILNPQRIYTISHEVGHHWLGHKLEMNISNQWFGEGFNDYITFHSLVAAGLLTPAEYENRINEIMQLHYSSQIRNTPNDSVFANYWKMGDYNKLPYRRGCIFAFYLDNQIRLASNGTRNMRDFLRALAVFRQGKSSGYEISVDDFVEQAAAFLPRQQLLSVLEDYIMKGNPIAFSQEMLTPEFNISYDKEIPRIKIMEEAKFLALFL